MSMKIQALGDKFQQISLYDFELYLYSSQNLVLLETNCIRLNSNDNWISLGIKDILGIRTFWCVWTPVIIYALGKHDVKDM